MIDFFEGCHESSRRFLSRSLTAPGYIAVLALLIASSPIAQAATPPSPADGTILHLSAQASVKTNPDLVVAEMSAQANAVSPVVAQRRVNNLMEKGRQIAHDNPEIYAEAGIYSVLPTDEKHTGWIASQRLELQGSDPAQLFQLVGKLQDQGFVTDWLGWQLSEAVFRKARDQATIDALKDLQSRASANAETLDLRIDHIQDLRIDAPSSPMPRMRAMGKFAAAAVAPDVTGAPQEVTASVSADILLRK